MKYLGFSKNLIAWFKSNLNYSPRDWEHIGIKWGTLSVIYRCKAYHIGFQKIYVTGSESVTGESYCTPPLSLRFQQVDILEKSFITIMQLLSFKA